ncbi:hypothetical protein [Cobetia sp. L2A1]|uniref:hypothetical protein n=1 Tax=Cobetia sp. L2A1 TaxID=2686360 RepID=UPI00131CF1E2|nr:hypothetical protein [Cobetia sp. L2A1]
MTVPSYTPSLLKISADKTLIINQRMLEVDTDELMGEEHAFRPTVATESLPLVPVRFRSNVQSTHPSEEFVNFDVIKAIISTQKVPASQSVFCIEIDIGKLNEDEIQVLRFYFRMLQPLLELGWEWINIYNLYTASDFKVNEKKLWNSILGNFNRDEKLQYAWSNVATQQNLPMTYKQISSMFKHRYSIDSIRKFMNETKNNTNTSQSGASKNKNAAHWATVTKTKKNNTNSKRKDDRKQESDTTKQINIKEKSKHSNNKGETDSDSQMELAI